VLAGGGREFRARRAAVGGGEEHWRTRISVLRRGNLTGVDLTAVASYSDAVEGLSHAATAAKQEGSHGESPELSPGDGFYLAALSGHRRRESQRRRRESQWRSVVGGEGRSCCRSDLSESLYHQKFGL
jgi:hypothetical protein